MPGGRGENRRDGGRRMSSAMRRYAGVGSRKTPAPITGANGGGRRSGGAPGIEVARPAVGRHGGSCERSKLVGPGLSRGARQACRRQGLRGMEPGHLRCRRRARSRPEGARTRRRKQTGGPAMAETKPLTAYWMHDVIRISEPLTIGKHAWRLVQYRGSESRYTVDETTGIGRHVEMPAIFVDYEWRRLDERFEDWRQGPRLAEVRLQRRTASRPAPQPAQALRHMPVGPPGPGRRHRYPGVAPR